MQAPSEDDCRMCVFNDAYKIASSLLKEDMNVIVSQQLVEIRQKRVIFVLALFQASTI